MKGVVFVGDRQSDIREVPKPTPGPGEVVLAMKASGLCGSDLRAYRLPRAQRGNPSALTVGGHEPCGIVAKVGPEVITVKVGDRIMAGYSLYPLGESWKSWLSRSRRLLYSFLHLLSTEACGALFSASGSSRLMADRGRLGRNSAELSTRSSMDGARSTGLWNSQKCSSAGPWA